MHALRTLWKATHPALRPWRVGIAGTHLCPLLVISFIRDGSAPGSFCLTRDSQVSTSRRLWSVCAGLVQARCELLQAQQELAISFRQRRVLQIHGTIPPELQQLVRAQVVLREQGQVCRS